MWLYSGDPSDSDKDKVRFDLGDTDTTDQLLQDEEIEFVLTQESSYAGVLARCCEAIARKYGKEALSSVGSLSFQNQTRATFWQGEGEKYRKKAAGSKGPSASASALGRDPLFALGMHDNLGPVAGSGDLSVV